MCPAALRRHPPLTEDLRANQPIAGQARDLRNRMVSFKGKNMLSSPRLLVMVCLAACTMAHSQNTPKKIGASAVWQIPQTYLASAHTACDKSFNAGRCFIDQMAKAGASSDAVAFTHELHK